MSKITLLMLVLAIVALYFGVFGWFLAGLFVFWAGARTYLKFEEPAATPSADNPEDKP
jgi:hypothetical protein